MEHGREIRDFGKPPNPETLAKYGRIDPEIPNRILKIIEQEGNHRRELEQFALKWAIRLDLLSVICAFILVIATLLVGVYFLVNGFPVTGATIITSVTVALGISFLTRGGRGKKEGNSME